MADFADPELLSEGENIWTAASDGDIDRVRELIESGMSPNAQDEAGYSPLHAASSYGEVPLIHYLLSVGADVNICKSSLLFFIYYWTLILIFSMMITYF